MQTMDRKRQASNSSDSSSSIDFRRNKKKKDFFIFVRKKMFILLFSGTFNLASVDVNYNEWKDENPTISNLVRNYFLNISNL